MDGRILEGSWLSAELSVIVFEPLKGDGMERIKGDAGCVVSLRKDEPKVEDLPCQTSAEGGLSMEAGL